MEYRLLKEKKKGKYFQIYNEETSELVGSAVFGRKWLVFRELQLRLGDDVFYARNGLFKRRQWKWSDTVLSIRSKLIGRRTTLSQGNNHFVADKFEKDKMELKAVSTKRTGLVINAGYFKSEDMVLIQQFDRFDLRTAFTSAFIVLDTYGIW